MTSQLPTGVFGRAYLEARGGAILRTKPPGITHQETPKRKEEVENKSIFGLPGSESVH